MKHLFRIIPSVVAASLLIVPALALAATDTFVSLTHIPGISGLTSAPTLPILLNNLYKLCIGAAAVIAVIQIIRAGISIMTNQGNFMQSSEARKRLVNTFLGLLLVLSPVIVFSIINPRILDLNLDFGGLQSDVTLQPSATTTSTGNETLDNLTAERCALFRTPPAQMAIVSLPQNKTCRDVKGNGWSTIDSTCCPVTAAGQSCCGYRPSDETAPAATDNLLGPASYSIAYQDSAYLSNSDTTMKACVAYDDQSFPTQAACTTAYNNTIAAMKGTYGIAKSCTDTGSHTITPASVATQFKNLPTCP